MNVNATRTGYYLAKFMNTVADFLKPLEEQDSRHYNPMLRKAEVWLNFAEASNEAFGPKVVGPGCTKSAYDVIKIIREKSGGITDVTYLDEMAASKETFRTLIQNERRIEFAFENQRFWTCAVGCYLSMSQFMECVLLVTVQETMYSRW